MQLTMWPLTVALVVVVTFSPVAASSASLVSRGASSVRGSIFRSSSIKGAAPAPAVEETSVAETADQTQEASIDLVTDSGDEVISDQLETSTPCSCDCCQVQKLLPRDVVQRPDGSLITSWCSKAPNNFGASGEDGALCPTTCQLDNGNTILSSSKGPVDSQRYCNYVCQPVTDSAGTACVQHSSKMYKEASNFTLYGGNGKQLYPLPIEGIGSGWTGKYGRNGAAATSTGAAATSDSAEACSGHVTQETCPPTSCTWSGTVCKAGVAQASVAAAAAARVQAATAKALTVGREANQEPKLKIVYDMRKLVAERLRSEAGADVASSAAAAERVRINKWTTKQNAMLLKKLRVKYGALVGKVEEGVAGIEAEKSTAEEAEKKIKKELAEGGTLAAKIAKETRDLTDEAIKKAITPCAAAAAKSRAEAKGLDKPEDWVKVVAARAANPYQSAVTQAVQRTSEYKHYADGLMDQAYAAQKQANELVPHVNVLEAQGDVMGATIEKKQVNNLLRRATTLQDEAKGYWNTAQSTRETIPKWQMAAQQAAAYAAWEYSNNAQAFR